MTKFVRRPEGWWVVHIEHEGRFHVSEKEPKLRPDREAVPLSLRYLLQKHKETPFECSLQTTHHPTAWHTARKILGNKNPELGRVLRVHKVHTVHTVHYANNLDKKATKLHVVSGMEGKALLHPEDLQQPLTFQDPISR